VAGTETDGINALTATVVYMALRYGTQKIGMDFDEILIID